jgi:5-methyltetrahydrofolate--homocysteine methyltransferase
MDNMLEEIKTLFKDYEEDELIARVQTAVDNGVEPLTIVTLLSKTLEEIGEEFSVGTLFLPDMIMAGDQMERCMDILRPALKAMGEGVPKGAKVVLGTVSGDIHSIGKNMVKTMLSVSGFDVIDLGVNVSAAQFYNSVVTEKPAIVALSSCMTTTIPSMADTIELLKSKGITDQVKIIVGGGSMNAELAKSLGSCIYGGHDAFEAIKILKSLVG